MAEFTRNKGRSDSCCAGSSANVGDSSREVVPPAVRETSDVVVGVAGDTAVGRETTLREGDSRNFRPTELGETAVLVEVGLARGQPDQPSRAGKWDAFPSGKLGGGLIFLSRAFWVSHTTLYHR